MTEFTLTLPRMKLECRRCRYTWKHGVPLWDRGHLLMKRGGKIVYVEDDLGYLLDESIDVAVLPLLREIGYSAFIDACSQCGHVDIRLVRGLLAPPNYGTENFDCTNLDENDFIRAGSKWRLRPEASDALTGHEAG